VWRQRDELDVEEPAGVASISDPQHRTRISASQAGKARHTLTEVVLVVCMTREAVRPASEAAAGIGRRLALGSDPPMASVGPIPIDRLPRPPRDALPQLLGGAVACGELFQAARLQVVDALGDVHRVVSGTLQVAADEDKSRRGAHTLG
jgi:hypothetical protein